MPLTSLSAASLVQCNKNTPGLVLQDCGRETALTVDVLNNECTFQSVHISVQIDFSSDRKAKLPATPHNLGKISHQKQ